MNVSLFIVFLLVASASASPQRLRDRIGANRRRPNNDPGQFDNSEIFVETALCKIGTSSKIVYCLSMWVSENSSSLISFHKNA